MTKDLMLNIALRYLNTPYRWGGDSPMEGFDCSGLVLELLKAAGVISGEVDINAQTIHAFFLKRSTQSALGFGSLCFYGKSPKDITHVAFMLDESSIIEAGGGGSATTTLEAAIKQNAYVRVRPYNNRRDLIDVLQPNYPWKGK
jgi:cell wall-associated NlpC family hydrolase